LRGNRYPHLSADSAQWSLSGRWGRGDLKADDLTFPIVSAGAEVSHVWLPRRLDPEILRAFLVDHRVAYVLLNNYDGYRRRYQSDLEALELQGVRVIPVGDYWVFDTRALWH
jgi:hypothetical protein